VKRLVLALIVLSVMAPGLAAQSAEDAEAVRQVVVDLFEHMKQGDADAMAALMHEDVRLVTTAVRDDVPTSLVVGVDGWLQNVGNSERELDERIHDVEVRVSGGLAMVWTGYDLYVDGLHSHCGVDLFELVLTADGWRIIGIADTRSNEGCRG
jgi:ketosteroid isomerase-like protein